MLNAPSDLIHSRYASCWCFTNISRFNMLGNLSLSPIRGGSILFRYPDTSRSRGWRKIVNLKKFLIFCNRWNSVRFLLTREVRLIPVCVCVSVGVCVCVCERVSECVCVCGGGGGVAVCVCVCDCEARYTFCETDYLSQSHKIL